MAAGADCPGENVSLLACPHPDTSIAPTTHAAANLNPAFIPFLLRALVFVGQDMVLFHILAERHTSPAEKSRARNERRFLLSECM